MMSSEAGPVLWCDPFPVRACAFGRTALPILWMGPGFAAGLGGPTWAATRRTAKVCQPPPAHMCVSCSLALPPYHAHALLIFRADALAIPCHPLPGSLKGVCPPREEDDDCLWGDEIRRKRSPAAGRLRLPWLLACPPCCVPDVCTCGCDSLPAPWSQPRILGRFDVLSS